MRLRMYTLVLPVGALLMLILIACGTSSGSYDSAPQSGPAAAVQTASSAACGNQYIPSTEAGDHIGEEGTVCGTVRDYIYVTGEKGRPTLLLFEVTALIENKSPTDNQQLPQTFEAVIWKEDAKNFPPNFAAAYDEEVVCVTGMIETHNDNPAIIVRAPEQLKTNC